MRSKLFFAAIVAMAALSGFSRTMVGGTGRISVDTRVGDLSLETSWYKSTTFDLLISTRWDSSESGILTVNGVEKASLEASSETNCSLVVGANVATTFVCAFTIGDKAYSRTLHTSGA